MNMGFENTERHKVISQKLLDLGTTLLKEGTEKKDVRIINLGITHIILGGNFLNDKAFNTVFNQIKMVSNSYLFDSLLQTDLRGAILEKVKEDEVKNKDLSDKINEIFNSDDEDDDEDFKCECNILDRQPYDGKNYPEYENLCLNCGGEID